MKLCQSLNQNLFFSQKPLPDMKSRHAATIQTTPAIVWQKKRRNGKRTGLNQQLMGKTFNTVKVSIC